MLLILSVLNAQTFDEAKTLYNDGEYEKAYAVLDKIGEDSPDYKKANRLKEQTKVKLLEQAQAALKEQADSIRQVAEINESKEQFEGLDTELPVQDGKIVYEGVIQTDGASADELYSRAKAWFISTFKDAKEVIQHDDKDGHQVIGVGFGDIHIVSIGIPQPVKLWTQISIMAKDGRYKYVIDDLRYQQYPSQYVSGKNKTPAELTIIDNLYKSNGKVATINAKYKTETIAYIERLIENIKEGMNKEIDDDW